MNATRCWTKVPPSAIVTTTRMLICQSHALDSVDPVKFDERSLAHAGLLTATVCLPFAGRVQLTLQILADPRDPAISVVDVTRNMGDHQAYLRMYAALEKAFSHENRFEAAILHMQGPRLSEDFQEEWQAWLAEHEDALV
jgi:hypothetical protein